MACEAAAASASSSCKESLEVTAVSSRFWGEVLNCGHFVQHIPSPVEALQRDALQVLSVGGEESILSKPGS